MKTLRLNLVVVAAAMAATQAWGQSAAKVDAQQAAVKEQAPAPTVTKRVIVVSLEDRKLALVEDGQVKKVYSVAVGKPSTPSPTGTFSIERRVKNPIYRHDGRTVLPGPGNPVGSRWMGLSVHGYGIHGTNEPKSIGNAASHGCIRMAKADLEEFYELVAEGDTVELVGARNDETARLFGSEQNLGAPRSQPALVASATAAAPVAVQGNAQDAGNAEKANLAAVAAFAALR
jgi:lipoprotein-anchoring transpeptidase ErfK/SrfK